MSGPRLQEAGGPISASTIPKQHRNREIDQLHERNSKAGHIAVEERNLHHTAIRDRKIYILLIVLMFLLMLCLFNLTVLAVVYSTLNISTSGMRSLSFECNGNTKWLQDSDLESIFPRDGIVGGFDATDMTFTGDRQNVSLHGGNTEHTSSLTVGPQRTVIQARTAFTFIDPFAKRSILHIGKSSNLKFGSSVLGPSLKSTAVQLPRVVGDETDLTINGTLIDVTGSEGVFLDGGRIRLTSEQDINITATHATSALKLSGQSGVYLDSVPVADPALPTLQSTNYRLCACSRNGRLFLIPAASGSVISCSLATTNPCP